MRIYFALILFFATSIVFSQYSISGKITDCQNNKAIANASVEIQGIQKQTISDNEGNFTFTNLPKGKYLYYVTKDGFKGTFHSVSLKENKNGVIFSICKDKAIEMEEVIVTATRSEKNLKNVPISVQVITSEDIRKSQAIDFQSFLETELSGINFSYEGGMPNINMMGFGGKYVLFLVNGERMAGETFDNIDYDRIDLDNIQRIEIIKGASSSLYGSNALGGVINIITKDINNPIEISTNYLYNSNKEHKANLAVGTKQKWGSIGVSSFYKQREPYILEDTEATKRIFNNGKIEKTDLYKMNIAGFTNYSVTPKVKLNVIPEKLELELMPTYYFSERNSGTESSKKVRDRYYNYTMATKANYTSASGDKFTLSGGFDRYDKFNYYILLNEEEKNYENTIWKVAAQHNKSLYNKHTIVSGAEILSDELLSFRFNNSGTEAKEKAKSYTLFTQQDWMLSPKFTFVTGVRMDYHSFFKEYFTFRASVMYKIDDKFTVRGGYSTGFRSPTLKELYTNWFHPWGGGFQIIGNKELKPETSNNINLSVDFNSKRWNITAMTQYSIIKDKIANEWTQSNDTIQYVNFSGKSRIIGSEFSASYRISKSLRLKGSYAFYSIEKRKSEERPHSFIFKAEYIPKYGEKYIPNVVLSGKFVSSTKLFAKNSDNEEYHIPYEGYSTWRLQAFSLLPYKITISAGIDNIFDYVTKTTSFYSSISPGRTYFVGLKWNFD